MYTKLSSTAQVFDLCESVQICRIFSAGFCKDRCTESWRSIQICKIFTEVCRFSSKIFAEICFSEALKNHKWINGITVQITRLTPKYLWLTRICLNILHFRTFSSTFLSILADLRSVSRNSPSLKIHAKEMLSPSRLFWCLGNICHWSYTNLSFLLELSRSGC